MFVTFATLLPWLAFVALVSLAPELPRLPGIRVGVASLLGHFAVYGGLAALIYWLHKEFWTDEDRRPFDSAAISAGVSAFIGLAVEWSQRILTDGRTFQTEDVAANVAGAALVSAILLLLEQSGSSLRLLRPAIFSAGALLTLTGATSYLLWDQSLPYSGDHWHAPYRVVVCGTQLPVFDANSGEIHSHGDGLIHIHPKTDGLEGKRANLGQFFKAAGGQLTDSTMTLPNGEIFENGDLCSDGSSGVVSVSLFDLESQMIIRTVSSPARHVPRNFELISIEFGPLPVIAGESN